MEVLQLGGARSHPIYFVVKSGRWFTLPTSTLSLLYHPVKTAALNLTWYAAFQSLPTHDSSQLLTCQSLTHKVHWGIFGILLTVFHQKPLLSNFRVYTTFMLGLTFFFYLLLEFSRASYSQAPHQDLVQTGISPTLFPRYLPFDLPGPYNPWTPLLPSSLAKQ